MTWGRVLLNNPQFPLIGLSGLVPFNFINRQTFTSSGTYTPHTGMQQCFVRLQAPGGGSGGVGAITASTNAGVSGSGAAGGYAERLLSSTQIGASQTVTIGAVGTAGASTPTAGGQGGTTSLGALISATGGLGGLVGVVSTTIAVTNGVAGGVGSSGDLNINGNASAASFSNFASVNIMYIAPGAGSIFGGSAPGQSAGSGVFLSATAGVNYGGGASGTGGTNVTHAAAAGATGGAGIIDILEFCLI